MRRCSLTAAERAELQGRGPAARRGVQQGEGSPMVKPMIDGPQASCTPIPLSPSWSAVRMNSNGKTTKLPGASQGGRASRRCCGGWLVGGAGPCPIRAHLSNQLGSAAGAAAAASPAAAAPVATAVPAVSSRIWASARNVLVPASSSMAEGDARLARSAGRDERSEAAAWKPSAGLSATRHSIALAAS